MHVIAVLVALIFGAGLFGYFEHRQLLQQKATAEDLFYAIKTQDIDLANLDRALASTNSQAGAEELANFVTGEGKWNRATTNTSRLCKFIARS